MYRVELETKPRAPKSRSIGRVWLRIRTTNNRAVAENVAQKVRIDYPSNIVRIVERRV